MATTATDEAMGPAFDTGTLLRPTQRKLVSCWMEFAGFKTLLLPRVWEELTQGAGSATRFRSSDAWRLLSNEPDLPFLFVHWTPALEDAAYELRHRFTEACFPRKSAEQILYDSDAVIVSQALALGTEMLVTSDVSTIDHYEVNLVAERQLGRNAGFVTTLDDALQHAHRGSDAGNSLLTLALTTIAPPPGEAWPVDAAYSDLGKLREALICAALPITAARFGDAVEPVRQLGRFPRTSASFGTRIQGARSRTNAYRMAQNPHDQPAPLTAIHKPLNHYHPCPKPPTLVAGIAVRERRTARTGLRPRPCDPRHWRLRAVGERGFLAAGRRARHPQA